MDLRNIQRGFLGLVLGLIVALPAATAIAQPAPADEPAADAQTNEPPTTQPLRPPDSQDAEALEKLLKLRDQMQHEQEEQAKSGQTGAKAPTPSGRPPAVARPRKPSATQTPAPTGQAGATPKGRPTVEELRARARASTQRAASTSPAAQQESVGPPETLSNSSLPSPGAAAEAAGPATPGEEGQARRPHREPGPDEPSEWFNFVNTPWEDVVTHFVERIGKPLLGGDVSIGGELTYVSDRTFTKPEALDELNLIMLEKGYRFVEQEHHVRIIPVNEMIQWVPLSDTYASVEAFEGAHPRDMEFVVVFYQVPDRPAQVFVDAFLNALSESTQMSALSDSNQIKIVGVARDVRRFMALKDRVDLTPGDPRVLRIFDITTNAADIEQRVRAFLRIGGGAVGAQPQIQMVRDPRTGRMVPQPVAQPPAAAAESEVLMVADERTNSIIVKATADKIEEIASLIKTLDQKPDIGEFKTEVVEIKHADATEVANLLNQILQQEQGQRNTPNWQQQRQLQLLQQQQQMQQRNRRGQPVPPQPVQVQPMVAPEDIMAEGIFERAKKTIRLVADTRTNSLIVYANNEGMLRVKEMLATIDQPLPDTYQVIALQNAKVSDIAQLVQQISQGMTQTGARAGRGVTIVPDEINNTFHVIAEREEMEKVGKLIEQLDVPAPEQERHIVELRNLRPSQVAQMVQALLGSSGGGGGAVIGPVTPGRGRMPTPARSSAALSASYQVIPLDEAQVLIVVCSDTDWAKIEQTIQMWDERAQTSTPQLETFTITQGNAQTIAATLSGFYRSYDHPVLGKSSVTIQADGDKVYVYAIRPAIDEIGALITSLDVESVSDKVEILPLVNADAAQVVLQLQPLFIPRGPRGATAGPLIQAETVTNSLIVQADKSDMEKIKDFAMKMDQKIGAQATEQRFYTMQYAQPQEVATAVQNIFGGQRGGRGAATAAQIRALAAGAQVMVEAPKDKFTAIETFIKQLDDPKGNEVQVKTVKLLGTDVGQVAQNLAAAIRPLQRPGRPQPTFTADQAGETVIVSATIDLMPKIDELLKQFASVAEELVPVTISPKYADPNQLAQMIQAMFRQVGGRGSPQQEVLVSVSNGQLIVKAPKKKLDEIQDLVAAVDMQDPTGVQIKTYDLKVLNAVQVQVAVQGFLTQIKKNVKSGQLAPGAYAEPTTNTLVVLAPPETLPFIDSLIEQLESKTPKEGQARTYTLKNVRAEQIAQNVDAMLKAKIAEKEGVKKGSIQTAIFPDPASNRLFVFAPDDYQELAGKLIEMVDADVATGELIHIVPLNDGDATQLAGSLNQMLQSGARGGQARVRITADAGSNSILLGGLPKDVAEVETWIKELEGNSVRVPEMQIFQVQYTTTKKVEDALKAVYGAARNPMDAVTVSTDEYNGQLIVTANKRKMRVVEQLIKQIDCPPPTEAEGRVGNRQVYFVDLYRGKASDIAWDVRDLLPKESEGGPSIESDWFDQYLIVKCRPAEYPQVEKLIRDFEARSKLETKIVTRKLRGDPDRILQYLQATGEAENIVLERTARPETTQSLVIPLWKEGEEPQIVKDKREREEKEKREREKNGRSESRQGRRAAPLAQLLLDDIEQDVCGQSPAAPQSPAFAARRAVRGASVVRPVMFAQAVLLDDEPPAVPGKARAPAAVPSTPKADTTPPATRPAVERPKTRIVYQEDGTILMQGPKEEVDDVNKAIDLLEEDLTLGEVIRIFQFRWGDVSAAADVLNIMFNERQQIVIPQPQQPQRGQQGQQGRQGDDRQQPNMLEQLRGVVGGQQQTGGKGKSGGQRMRIATDPGHNYLIVKCDEADLPEIIKLLRELDIPPGEVQIKIFQLKNLLADETAQNISDVLGISKVQQRRGGNIPQMPRGGQNPQQQQLMEMLQQQLVSVPGVEGGAKVERVEIVPNGVTNSLLVSAPPEVMSLIERVIGDLEDLEGRGVRGIHYYQLKQARMDDILPLLQEMFSSAAGGGGVSLGGGPEGMPRSRTRISSSGSPAALGAVSLSGDPRTNTIIYTAENKDIEVIEKQIKALDIDGLVAEAELYVCQWAEAEAIAAALEPLFVTGGGGGRGPRGGDASSATGAAVRIVAEAATNTILVWGPLDKRNLIFEQIEALDKLSQRGIREIAVVHADPERLADMLSGVFAGGGAQSVVRRAGARSGRMPGATGAGTATGGGRVMIVGDKAAKKLLVRAPDEMFKEIQDLVATLDVPNQDMKLKQFQLKYAEAESVVDSVKQALTEYIQLAKTTGTDTDFDAFTAMPDARTNSIAVVGSDKTFLFVSQVLAAIDVPTPADQKKEFRIFMLEKANALTVADAINTFAGGAAAQGAAGRSGGARRTGGGPGGMPAGGRELNVTAVAEEATNSVMVIGKKEDIDLVEDNVIAQLEDTIRDNLQIATVPVKNVPPSEIVSFIWQFLDTGTPQAGGQRTGRGGQAAGETQGPQIVPNDTTKTLVVRGTRRQIQEVNELVAKFDDISIVQQPVKIIEVPLGQDARTLATEVERVVNQNEEEAARTTGRRARRVVVGSDDATNSLILAGDPSIFGLAENIVNQLTGIYGKTELVTRVIELKNLSAQDAETLVNELQQRKTTGGGRGQSGSGVRRPSSSSGTSPNIRPPSSTTGGQRTPRRTPASPPRTPSGGSPPKPSGALWPGHLPGLDDQPAIVKPVAWAAPYFALTPVLPFFRTLLVSELLDDEPPAREQPRPRREMPTSRPAATPRATPATLQPSEPPAEEAPASEPGEIEEGLTGVTGSLRGEVTANAIDSQRIVITGDKKDVDFIEQILSMMEQTSAIAGVEVFPLLEAKATAVAPIIDKSIKAWIDARTSKPGPQDRFSINAEARSNSLIVSATDPILDKIAELVEKLDVKKATGGPETKKFPLAHIRASEAAAILRPTIERYNAMNEIPKDSQPSIDPIDRDNSIMIIGTPRDIHEIESWLQALDIELTQEQKEAGFTTADAVVIQLQNGSADDIAKVINDMIKAEQEAAAQGGGDKKAAGKPFVKLIRLRLADGTELPELNLERPIKLVPEKGTNSLIIFSSRENNEALAAIVGLFDTLPIGAETDVKAFALQHASSEVVAKLIEDTFKDKSYLNRPSEGDAKTLPKGVMPPVPPGVAAKGLPYPLVVQHDVRSNMVVVVGRKDAVLLAAGLIKELDQPSLELALKPYVVQLKNAQAAQIQEKFKKLLDDRAKALGGDKNAARDNAIVYADERSNKLIVLATEELYDLVEDLVLQLDAADKYSIVDVRYHALKHADAVKLKNMLEETFKSRADAEKKTNKDAADTLAVLADTRSNSLLMTGTRDYLDAAERLAAELDQKADGTVEFQAVRLRLNTAPNVASLLKDMVDKALTQKDSKLSGTPIHVSSDPVSDAVLLGASREDMDVLIRWVDILDRPSEVGRMTKIIPLQRGIAEDVSKSVADIFKNKGGQTGGEIDVSVSADKTTNSVVAFGPPALLADIEGFVKQLDETTPTKGTVVRIFKLEQAAAQDAGDLLARILDLRGGSVGGTGGSSSSSGGTTKDAAKQVMLIFQQLRPDLSVDTLKAIRSDIVVISDIRTNSLVVTAPPESMPLMESLVAAVDMPPQDAKIRVFRLRNADAEQMVKNLETLFQQKSSTGGSRSGAGDSERVLALGEGLGGEGGRQEIAFTTDVRTNSVIAAGTPGYLDLAGELILELDTIPIGDRVTRVYPPKNITAEALAPSIKEFSDAEQQRLTDIGKDVSVGVKQERQITAIASKDANRIILDYDPRFEETVMNVVRDLDQPPPQVMIQVLIVEVTMDNELDLGVEFAFQDLQFAKAGPQDTTTFDYVGGTDLGAAGSGLGGFSFTITGADFNFLFRTLQNEGNLNVLSRPQIVAMDNQEAFIDISNDVPYVTGTSTTTGGQITTSVARERIGIKLTVTPQINTDGFVRMDVRQEVSDFTGSTVDVGQGVTAPVFFRREAKTNVMVKDNETVVLGGLITSRQENREQKIPIVGDIPGLGLLFRNQNDTNKRTELLVVLTPHVIRTVDDYRDLSTIERDRMEIIPTETMADPLMQGLRVPVEELPEIQAEAQNGPVEQSGPAKPTGEAQERPVESYGPVRPARKPEDKRPPAGPDSYDVPVSFRTR